MIIVPISQARFDALTYSRNPAVKYFGEEVEWYSDSREKVLGVLLLEKIDNDWIFVILGRDEKALFRAIDFGNYDDIDSTRNALFAKLEKQAAQETSVFPQFDTDKKKNLIFEQIVPAEKLHPYFKALSEQEGYSPAKEIIREIVYAFEDPDGNYIEQFQSTAFDSRLWELYLYAYLHEADFDLSRDYPAPDFTCDKFGMTVCIEAVTVNPTQNAAREDMPTTREEMEAKLQDYMPIKFGSPLFSKLDKKYWEKEHVKGNPLIFAIHDFHQEGSMLWSSSALTNYLYGIRHNWEKDPDGNLIIIPEKIMSHKYGEKEIPSGFFLLPEAENISAVLFSNSATISKFNRMGKLAGFGSRRVKMFRVGTCRNHDPNATSPRTFKIEVDEKVYQEKWRDGLSMYHNPRALNPIPIDLFPGIAHHDLEDGQLVSEMPHFFPYASITQIFVEK